MLVSTNEFQNHSLSGDSYYVNKSSLLCQQVFTCLQHVLYWKFVLANCKLVLHNSLFMFYAPPFSSDIISAVSRNYILTRIFNCCQPVFCIALIVTAYRILIYLLYKASSTEYKHSGYLLKKVFSAPKFALLNTII